jgi:hypothetical protein
MDDKRSFTIEFAAHVDGCPTKFSRGDYSGRYISRTASGAAKKALTELCASKRIRGACTLFLKMRETTQGSAKKVFMYHAKRVKLAEPIEITKGVKVYYQNRVVSVDENQIPKCKKSHKSSGRMMKHVSKAKKSKKSKSIKSKKAMSSKSKKVMSGKSKKVMKSKKPRSLRNFLGL